MGQDRYLIKPTSECIKYIESFGHSVDSLDFFKTTPSGSGLVYKLKNKKVVLIPSDFNLKYPGFIFESETDLDSMIKTNFFPLNENHMTVWEMEKKYLDGLPFTIEYFKNFLLLELNYKQEILSLADVQTLYNLLAIKIKECKAFVEKQKLLISFGIIVIHFLAEKKANWLFETRYEIYNPYQYPKLKTESQAIDVVELVFICFADDTSDFNFFINSLEE